MALDFDFFRNHNNPALCMLLQVCDKSSKETRGSEGSAARPKPMKTHPQGNRVLPILSHEDF
jgi:hypothetical protein